MLSDLVLTVLVLVFFYFFQQWLSRKWANLPPGPLGLPFVGYLPFMGDDPSESFRSLAKKYGNVYSIQLGSANGIILNDYKTIREAFGKNEFLGRPRESITNFLPRFISFFNMSGPKWVEQRRFTLQTLKHLGMNRSSYCLKIKEEIDCLVDKLKESQGELIDVKVLLSPSMSNNIFSLVFGRRMDYDNPERKKLDEGLFKSNKFLGQAGVMAFMPWVIKIVQKFNLMGFNEFVETFGYIQEFIRKDMELHRQKHDPDNPKDYIDYYLNEVKKRDATTNTTFTDDMLAGNVQLLFGAGSVTVRTSVNWALLTLAVFQDVQDKVRKEIQSVVGPDRDVEWEDHSRCVYTEAVMMELQRWKTVTPLGIIHSTTDDTTVAGYRIPKNTFVIPNLTAAHHDADYWGDPEVFRPERFLDETRTILVKHEAYMPFAVGKRSCPGEALALMENFLYIATIVHKFKIELGKGIKPSFGGSFGIGYEPNITSFRIFSVES